MQGNRPEISIPRLLRHLAKTGLALLAIGLIAYFISWQEIANALGDSDPFWLSVCVLLLPINQLLHSWTWYTLLIRLGQSVSFKSSLAAVLCGQTLGLLTPARLGDFAGRIFYLSENNRWAVAAITGVQQVVAFGVYVAFGIVALLVFLFDTIGMAGFAWYLVFLLGLGGLLLISLVIKQPQLFYETVSRLPIRQLKTHLLFLRDLKSVDMQLAFLQTSLRYIVFSVQFFVLLLAFGAQIAPHNALIAIALVFYAKSVIPSPTLAELGIREGAAIYFLGAYGVGAAIAFGASFLLFTVNIVLPALIGLPFLLKIWFGTSATSSAVALPHPTAVDRP